MTLTTCRPHTDVPLCLQMDSEIKESSEVCESGESKGKDALETKWNDNCMTEALKSAEKSEDPKTQVSQILALDSYYGIILAKYIPSSIIIW